MMPDLPPDAAALTPVLLAVWLLLLLAPLAATLVLALGQLGDR